jgi:hypothetical protein
MEAARVVEILLDSESVGSCYLITSRHVLTAGHVAAAGGDRARWAVRPAEAVDSATKPLHRRRRPRAQGADVIWRSKRVDLAVLALAKSVTGLPNQPVELARVSPDMVKLDCAARGFPQAAGAEDRLVAGGIAWAVSAEPLRFDVNVENIRPEELEGWGGLSGAAVFVGAALVAVAAKADGNWGNGSLEATPVEYLESEKELTRYFEGQGLALRFVALGETRRAVDAGCARARLGELVELVDRRALPQDLLRQLYCSSLPPTAAPRSGGSLRAALAHLADLPPPVDGGPPPLWRLLREIAERLPDLRPGVETWLQKVGLGAFDIASDGSAAPRPHHYYVAVELSAETSPLGPGPNGEPRLGRIAHIRVFKDEDIQPLADGWDPEGPVSLEEVRQALIARLDALQQELSYVGGDTGAVVIVVEFCVPHALLAEPFDEWLVPGEFGAQQPLGVVYLSVLRDIERPPLWSVRRLWSERWKRLWQTPRPLGGEPYWVRTRQSFSPRQLYDALSGPEAEPQLCIALGFAADAEWLGPGDRDFLFAAWHAGLPAAVWFRSPRAGAEPDAHWSRLMTGALMHELPRRLWELRRAAHRGEQAFGVSLVWDDPGRIPFVPKERAGDGR